MASPSPPLEFVDVDICPKCAVPNAYCTFFGHVVKPEGEGEGDAEQPEAPKAKAPANKKEAAKQNVIVTVKQRTKKKNTTSIKNLEGWNVDVKEFCKTIKKKMAIGCSTKNGPTGVEIVIQGDAGQQVIDILLKQYKVPKGNIQAVRKAKKKTAEEVAAANQPPPQPGMESDDDDDDDDDSDE